MRHAILLSIVIVLLSAAAGFAQGIQGDWVVVEMKSPQGTTKLNNGGTNLNFLKGSKWEMIHATGNTEAGAYVLKGSKLLMEYEGGEDFGSFEISFSGNRLILDGTGSSKGYGYTLERTR
jgi:hypothetical protein